MTGSQAWIAAIPGASGAGAAPGLAFTSHPGMSAAVAITGMVLSALVGVLNSDVLVEIARARAAAATASELRRESTPRRAWLRRRRTSVGGRGGS